jgi:hypothetical protein
MIAQSTLGRFEEELVHQLSAGLTVLLWLSGAPAALAQDQQSFRPTPDKRYANKGVAFAEGDETENREVFVVTLQREKALAV